MSKREINIETTENLFTAFGAADVPGMLEFVNDDIVIEFYGPDVIPYAGFYRGREAARRFFETVLLSVQINQFEPQEMLADADKVIVTGHLNLTTKTTGRMIDSDFAQVITLKDGKWSRFRDFMDTANAVAAFSE